MAWCVLRLMPWYGMAWYGLVCAHHLRLMLWYGMVWYGMVWYDMAWYGAYLPSKNDNCNVLCDLVEIWLDLVCAQHLRLMPPSSHPRLPPVTYHRHPQN